MVQRRRVVFSKGKIVKAQLMLGVGGKLSCAGRKPVHKQGCWISGSIEYLAHLSVSWPDYLGSCG